MPKKPILTFVLGILNAELTFRECLDSIFMQQFPKEDYEVIIIDGGSTDKTLDIIKEYQKKQKNIKLMNNPNKLSEGKGMSKDIGIKEAKGKYVALLDHDNIIENKDWIKDMIFSLEQSDKIMASQSLLSFRHSDTNFLKYVNAIGVEDPFAIPYSLVAQVSLYPDKFQLIEGRYYIHQLDPKNVLFGGANGCIFRKSVFNIIGGYTRDVDVFACMANYKMKVAISKNSRIYHKTSPELSRHLKKKGLYFYRFINNDYSWKKFNWVKPGIRNKAGFFLMVAYNLSLILPSLFALKKVKETSQGFWIIHPFYLFFITWEYAFITLFKFSNFLKYSSC
jgi:glycosyltransferase involved in cell wall biosynthesis